MSRIRTIKPEMAKHEGLYDLELETGLPVRFAWAMLPTACDREGRFQWRPRTLKADLLPHDPIEFSRVLDAWLTRGYIVKYRVKNEWFGWVPTFRKHQVINTRETASALPSIDAAEEVIDNRNQQLADASGTRQARDDDASGTRAVHARGEGKGREGKGREGKKEEHASSPAGSLLPEPKTIISLPLNDGSEFPVTEDQATEFSKLYPAVDVAQALRAMRGWCLAKPQRRKTRGGVLSFVNTWLSKEQDGSRFVNGGYSPQPSAGEPVRTRKELGA